MPAAALSTVCQSPNPRAAWSKTGEGYLDSRTPIFEDSTVLHSHDLTF